MLASCTTDLADVRLVVLACRFDAVAWRRCWIAPSWPPIFSSCCNAKSTTLSAELAPAIVLTLTPASVVSAEFVLRPAANVPVPAKPVIEMLSPCDCVRMRWLLASTDAVTPVAAVCWLIELTNDCSPAGVTAETVAEILTGLVCAPPLPLPRVNEIDPAVTVKATLVVAVALTLVFEVLALTACAIACADSFPAETLNVALPADPDTAILPAVNAPAPAAVIA